MTLATVMLAIQATALVWWVGIVSLESYLITEWMIESQVRASIIILQKICKYLLIWLGIFYFSLDIYKVIYMNS